MHDTSDFLRRIWFVGFAGHRVVVNPSAIKAAISRELQVIVASVDGELVGVASAAAGTDLLFLDACREAGLKTVVLLPFPKERFALDFENPEEWNHACHCMEAAWWCEVSPGGEDAPEAYHVVARESMALADRMLFHWDGQAARGLGGTGESIREASERKIPSRVIDAHTLQASWSAGEPEHGETHPDFDDLPAATSIEELFQKLDARAMRSAPLSRWFAAGSLSLNHLATILQAVLVAFALAAAEAGGMLKLIIISVAALLPWVGGRLQWKAQWIRDRIRTELLRSLLSSHEPASPLCPPALELFGGDDVFIRTAALHLVPRRRGWEATRDDYLRERVDGQIGYLKSKGALAEKRMAVFGRFFWVASWGGIVLGGVVVINAYFKTEVISSWGVPLGLTTAVLPGIAAWCLTMISVFEFKRRATLYRHLEEELIRLRVKLASANCASAVAQVMKQIERLLLNELWEWQGSMKK